MMLPSRRELLVGAGAMGALAACSSGRPRLDLAPLRIGPDHITRINVCTRPFRAAGPRTDVERIGEKTVIHNYGHGGSGWSLSWGAAQLACESVLPIGERDVAVIGCGAIGLTTAVQLQRQGLRVTIYAKDLPPNVRSSLATGLWTPDSRYMLESQVTPEAQQRWERLARFSWRAYQDWLGLAGTPVEYIPLYIVSDRSTGDEANEAEEAGPGFALLRRPALNDLRVGYSEVEPGTTVFGKRDVGQSRQLMFNIASYQRLLVEDFYRAGGTIVVTELHGVSDFTTLREKVVVNCTGFGARALLGDTSVIPVRGQTVRTEPRPEINYGVFYDEAIMVPRRDGLLFQIGGTEDYRGYNDDSTAPDRDEAEKTVATIAKVYR